MTALHEAGHAVVSLALGWRPRRAELCPLETPHLDGTYEAEKRRMNPSIGRHRRMVLARMMGGLEAERRRTRRSILDLCAFGGAGADYNAAVRLAAAHVGPSSAVTTEAVEAEIEQGRQLARDLVRKHWRAVDAVARALYRHGVLPGGDILRVAVAVDPRLKPARARRRRRSTPEKSSHRQR